MGHVNTSEFNLPYNQINTDVIFSVFQATMLKKSKNKIRRRNTEPSIFFPENDNLKAQSPSEESSGGPL